MARNGSIVVPQAVVDVLGPRLARSTKPNRNPGAVMAEELYRDDDVRPILLKALGGNAPNATEMARLRATPLVSGNWEDSIDELRRRAPQAGG